MLQQTLQRLYRQLRLTSYRQIFGAIRERSGSLSATEAFSADVIQLLGAPTLSQFAQYLGISQPNATYKINNLVAKGYVEKVRGEEDGRIVYVSLTRQGRRIDSAHRYFHESMVRSIIRDMTESEMQALYKGVMKLDAFLKEQLK